MHDLAAGARYLGRGQQWVLRHGRWFGFGLLPALVTLVLYVAALTVVGFWADDLAEWATPFADSWESPWQGLLRTVFAVLFWLAVAALAVVTFAAVTLLIGEPFYEKLSEQVETDEGGLPAGGPDHPLWRELWISLCDSLYVLGRTLLWTVPLFFLGFVPFVGQSVIPVIAICVTGFFLALELTSVAMQRRGIAVRQRLAMLRQRKALALGFGAPLALLFLVPFVAVLLMPGAVAGAALLVRDLTGEGRRDDERPGQPGQPQGVRGTAYPAAPPYGQPPHGQSPYGQPPQQFPAGPAGPAGPSPQAHPYH
ncbi:EI24 domain-containing protein [Streptomyces sp. NPDC048172]|uniref:EI24 domain-containing protein n=1 Tax=Streptomyces sp. NPDC048172 TaxID=3365505 RepID=UPI00372474C9